MRPRSKSPETLRDQFKTAERLAGLQGQRVLSEQRQNEIQQQLQTDTEHIDPKDKSLLTRLLSMPPHQVRELVGERQWNLYVRWMRQLAIRIRAQTNLQRYIDGWATKKHNLRSGQPETIIALRNFLAVKGEETQDIGYIKIPTGVGKTVIFIELCDALQLPTIVVAPTNDLVEQTRKRFVERRARRDGVSLPKTDDKAAWTSLYERYASDIGIFNENSKTCDSRIVITTYNSFTTNEQLRRALHNYQLFIFDEAHHSNTDIRAEVIKSLPGIKIGLTATPDYHDGKQLFDLFPNIIHTMTIEWAMDQGLICPVETELYKTNFDFSVTNPTTSDIDAVTGQENEDDDDEQNDTRLSRFDFLERNRLAVEIWLDHEQKTKTGKAVIFCANVKHARHVADVFTSEGYTAATLVGTMSEEERQRVINDFTTGKIQVLTGVNMLGEGFDDVEVEIGIRMAPVFKSILKCEQSIGRVMRVDNNNPHKISTFIDVVDEYKFKAQPILAADILQHRRTTGYVGDTRDQSGIDKRPDNDGGQKEIQDDPEFIYYIREKKRRLKDGYPTEDYTAWADIDMLREEDFTQGERTDEQFAKWKKQIAVLLNHKIAAQKIRQLERKIHNKKRVLVPVAWLIKTVLEISRRIEEEEAVVEINRQADISVIDERGLYIYRGTTYVSQAQLNKLLPEYKKDIALLFMQNADYVDEIPIPLSEHERAKARCITLEGLIEAVNNLEITPSWKHTIEKTFNIKLSA